MAYCSWLRARFPFVLFLLLQILINGSLGHGSHKDGKNTNPVVTTPLGVMRGSTMDSRRGATIFAFRGIRYAEAPVGNLRFQPPVPAKPWEGTYDATKNPPLCPQSFVNETKEDCLFLNVYTLHLPNKHRSTSRPVMVFFHPGGFYEGISSSDFFGTQYLLDEDIVLVVPNYRLQTLGFLATGTAEAPGNNGLKDQVQVLRWVQQNIASFSGNPNDVTISGYSAGGYSVTLHMVSPMSQGLFHKAIPMSGSALGNIPLTTDLKQFAKKQAEMVNCPYEPADALVNCLKTKTSDELSNNLEGYKEFMNEPIWLWTAVVEQDFGQERFLVEHPIKSVINKRVADVPVLIGVTTDEFGGRSYFVVDNKTALEEFDQDYKRVWPIVFSYERDTNFSFKVSEGLRNFYFPDNKIDASKRPEMADLYADGIIGFGTNRATKLFAENLASKVYSYRFNYKGNYTFFRIPETDTVYGVSHHDDLLYLFYISSFTPMFTNGPESLIVDKMTKMWGNFIKLGNPSTKSYEWPPYDLKTGEFLDISENLTTLSFLFEDRYETWEKLFPLSIYLN